MGPLSGIRVVELAGLGPAPFAAMLLGDLGADVIRIDRPGGDPLLGRVNCRNRRSIGLDLSKPEAAQVVLALVDTADVLIEGFRPGVAERLGVGPDACMGSNPRVVYARMTGWGQDGPLRDRAGHDINYIALTGALESIGPADGKPVPPLNLVGDFGGGSLYLVMGVLAALVERVGSGSGQIVDAAMVDGASSLMTMHYELEALGLWPEARGENLLDGGAPFYDTYETADGRYVAVGALEPQFFSELLDLLEVHDYPASSQYDRATWPELRSLLAAAFSERPREHWEQLFSTSDACVWPVLSMDEAPDHPYNTERGVFVELDGVKTAGPAPRFSRSVPSFPGSAPTPGEHTDEILTAVGLGARTRELRDAGVVF